MYIRRSTRVYKDKTYTTYLLVEAVQTEKGPRQKTICSLGDLSPRPRAEWLKLAHKLEHALAGQGELLHGQVLPRDPELDGLVEKIRGRHRPSLPRRRPGARPTAAPVQPPASTATDGGFIAVDPRRVSTEQHREAGPVHSLPRRRPGSVINSGTASVWTTSCARSGFPARPASSPARWFSIG
jgi:hypothetical protein